MLTAFEVVSVFYLRRKPDQKNITLYLEAVRGKSICNSEASDRHSKIYCGISLAHWFINSNGPGNILQHSCPLPNRA